MMNCLERGSLHRITTSTLMNETSSRSHAIFTIFLEQHPIANLYDQNENSNKKVKNETNNEFITAKFHFVDLAVFLLILIFNLYH